MILLRKNALFVHIPKTGGNSIQNLLLPYADDKKVIMPSWQDGTNRFGLQNEKYPTTKHSGLSEYKRYLEESIFDNMFKFTVVRNTYSRVMSFYFSPHRGNVSWHRGAFIAFVGSIKPIKHFTAIAGQSLAESIDNFDLVVPFSDLGHGVEKVTEMLDIPGSLGLWNVGSEINKLKYYDPDLIELVHMHFAEEIEYFGFSPPPTRGTEQADVERVSVGEAEDRQCRDE